MKLFYGSVSKAQFLLLGGGTFVGGIFLGLLLGLIITGVILFVLYKKQNIILQGNKEKNGIHVYEIFFSAEYINQHEIYIA